MSRVHAVIACVVLLGCLVPVATSAEPSGAPVPVVVAAAAPAPPIRLQVGEAITFCVDSRQLHNAAGVCLEANAHYQFTVAVGDTWCDGKIRCAANGWTARDVRPIARPLIRALEPRRRCPAANWFELVGSVGCDGCELFRIGCRGVGWTYSPCRDGELFAFANDLPRRYHNNSGSLLVTVQRVAEPGACRLPACR